MCSSMNERSPAWVSSAMLQNAGFTCRRMRPGIKRDGRTAMTMSLRNVCTCSGRNTGHATPKIIYYHYLKKSFLDQSIKKNVVFSFDNRSTVVDRTYPAYMCSSMNERSPAWVSSAMLQNAGFTCRRMRPGINRDGRTAMTMSLHSVCTCTPSRSMSRNQKLEWRKCATHTSDPRANMRYHSSRSFSWNNASPAAREERFWFHN